MTNDSDHLDDAPDDLAIVAALLDGEDVNAKALRRALDNDAARDYLVELLALRTSVAGLGPRHLVTPATGTHRPAWWGTLAAMLALATAAGGYAVGHRQGKDEPSFRGTARVEIVDTPRAQAPTPTEIIRLVPGKDWHSVKGN